MKAKGVAISEFNWTRKSVNFQALKEEGVGFVIIRCGFGNDDPSQDDKNWEQGVRGAEAAGLPWGAYLMSYLVDLSIEFSDRRRRRKAWRKKQRPTRASRWESERSPHADED